MTEPSLVELGRRATAAARVVGQASTTPKDLALRLSADLLEDHLEDLLAANQRDLERTEEQGATPTQLDRLRLSEARVAGMAGGLRQIATLPDPVGEVIEGQRRPNGLQILRTRVALGVIGIIYENRPNVTSDAAGLCLKAGNATLLRGSSNAIESNRTIVALLRQGIGKAGLPEDAVLLVADTSRETATTFMQLDGVIDCLIPRGGASLIASIREHATVPTIIDGDGNCHVYVDRAADLEMAEKIIVNAKTQRPGVCNAAESLLVHREVADTFLPQARIALEGVRLLGDDATRRILPGIESASDTDFATEFLDLTLSVAVVDDLGAAIDHIARYGSGHSEAIVTGDLAAADRFCREVDAAAVLVNASTRFVDGEEFGLGAEIGISTQKLHARGPMGLRDLTCVKSVVRGNGQVRG
jgi:glutamate-5-semialdehyde dehydrogenase